MRLLMMVRPCSVAPRVPACNRDNGRRDARCHSGDLPGEGSCERVVGLELLFRRALGVRFPPVMVGAGWHCGGVKENETTAPGGVAALDDERRYQAAVSKDPRFDGVFFIGVTSTGIYCRPSCPAITPKRANMRFYRSAAAAQESGFRACKRCRPDASPGSPEWNIRADVVGRAMRLIADGVVDRDGVEGLASLLGYEQRQVRRLVTAELGAGPLAIARAQRAQTARILTETTALPLSEIAFAAGFASIRQFNATIREVFAVTPSQLREARGKRAPHKPAQTRRLPTLVHGDPSAPGLIRLRLAYRAPIDGERMLGYLAARAIPGVEEVRDGCYRRTINLPNGVGILSLGPLVPSPGQHRPGGTRPDPGYVECELQLEDLRDLTAAVQRCRRLLDLDADPETVTGYLAADPVLGPLARANPGRRSPGHVDGSELAAAGRARPAGVGGRGPAARGAADRRLRQAAVPPGRAADALLPGRRDAGRRRPGHAADAAQPRPGADRTGRGAGRRRGVARPGRRPGAAPRPTLLALPGIGPWTVSYIRMRALSDPDAFLPTDVGVLEALARLGALPVASGPRRRGLARPGPRRRWPSG